MKDIIIYCKNHYVRLTFHDMFFPSGHHVKADVWTPRYQLVQEGSTLFPTFFTSKYWLFEAQDLLVLEAFTTGFDPATITFEREIQRCLVLIDFSRPHYATFSSITGGYFEDLRLQEGILIYNKRYPNYTQEMEVDINELPFSKLNLP